MEEAEEEEENTRNGCACCYDPRHVLLQEAEKRPQRS